MARLNNREYTMRQAKRAAYSDYSKGLDSNFTRYGARAGSAWAKWYTDAFHTYEQGKSANGCLICGRQLNMPDEPDSLDCGGDCLACIKEAERNETAQQLTAQQLTDKRQELLLEWQKFFGNVSPAPEYFDPSSVVSNKLVDRYKCDATDTFVQGHNAQLVDLYNDDLLHDMLVTWECMVSIHNKNDKCWPWFFPTEGYAAQRQWVIDNQEQITKEIIEWAGSRYGNDPFDLELAPEFFEAATLREPRATKRMQKILNIPQEG